MHRRDETGVEGAAIERLVALDRRRVIDVGCGDGRLTTFAAARGATVYAFDPNQESLIAAEAALTAEQRHRVRFAAHTAETLEVARERFDIALCGWSL